MIATLIEIERLSYKKVKYYTIKFENSVSSEFTKFWNKMYDNFDSKSDLFEIYSWIDKMGKERGAKERYFKHERAANALPTHYETQKELGNYGVRLYCIRISESIVILLNGDVKTADKANDCENVRPHFNLANKVALKINRDIIEKCMSVEKNELIFDQDYYLDL